MPSLFLSLNFPNLLQKYVHTDATQSKSTSLLWNFPFLLQLHHFLRIHMYYYMILHTYTKKISKSIPWKIMNLPSFQTKIHHHAQKHMQGLCNVLNCLKINLPFLCQRKYSILDWNATVEGIKCRLCIQCSSTPRGNYFTFKVVRYIGTSSSLGGFRIVYFHLVHRYL